MVELTWQLEGRAMERQVNKPKIALAQCTGGGIAGVFAICAVPMWIQDLDEANIRRWAYFSQISDAETSYGGYSGASRFVVVD
jgi:deoxyhypusine synthase